MIPPASPESIIQMSSATGRISRAFRQLRTARSTWQLIRIFLIIQAIPLIWNLTAPHGPERLSQLQYILGLQTQTALSGKIWQTITYGFIHGNWNHLLLNATAILLLGSKLEQFVAKRTFWVLIFLANLSGGAIFILSDLLTPFHEAAAPQTLVGSSAVCFAFLVFLATLSPQSKFLPLFLSGRSLSIGIILANFILTVINPDLPTGQLATLGRYLTENYFPDLFKISHACHLGGSLVGLLLGKWLLRPRISLKSLKLAREKREKTSGSQN